MRPRVRSLIVLIGWACRVNLAVVDSGFCASRVFDRVTLWFTSTGTGAASTRWTPHVRRCHDCFRFTLGGSAAHWEETPEDLPAAIREIKSAIRASIESSGRSVEQVAQALEERIGERAGDRSGEGGG